MDKVSLAVNKRNDVGGKGEKQRLRNQGIIPGVLYDNGDSHPVQVLTKDFSNILKRYGSNAILQVSYEGNSRQVFIKEVQRDPVKQQLLHFDLQPIAADEFMQLSIPIQIEGQNAVESKGGILQRQLQEIDVEALPQDIPQVIRVDISHMDIGDVLQVGDINVAEGVKILSNPDETIILVSEAAMEVEEDDEVDSPIETSVESVDNENQ